VVERVLLPAVAINGMSRFQFFRTARRSALGPEKQRILLSVGVVGCSKRPVDPHRRIGRIETLLLLDHSSCLFRIGNISGFMLVVEKVVNEIGVAEILSSVESTLIVGFSSKFLFNLLLPGHMLSSVG